MRNCKFVLPILALAGLCIGAAALLLGRRAGR